MFRKWKLSYILALMVCQNLSVALAEHEDLFVGIHQVFEYPITVDEIPDNPFTQANLRATFKGPDGKSTRLSGFYFGDKTWKVRFVPRQKGDWTFEIVLSGKGLAKTVTGNFVCIKSGKHGFLAVSKINPYRLVYHDGTPFYPIGQQMGWGVPPKVGFDGEVKDSKKVTREKFFEAFNGATNLIRSQLGCGTKSGVALPVIKKNAALDQYDLKACLKMDLSCQMIKANGWSQILIFFQDMSLWGKSPTSFGSTQDTVDYKNLSGKALPHIEQYIQYVIARWGAYVDIWELFNEDAYSPDNFLAHLVKRVRKADPYRHPIMTNYERPRADWCEILSLHEYMALPSHKVPAHLSKEFAAFKSFGKPVLYTEFGNQKPFGNVAPIKWRVAAWTAFMNECGLMFWNTSGKIYPDIPSWGGNPNAYLGPDTRAYLKVLADLTKDLPVDLRPVTAFTDHQEIELWALSNGKRAILYVNNPAGHKKEIKPEGIIVGLGKGTYTIIWIDPGTGKVIKEETKASKGNMLWLKVPPLTVDLAASVTRNPVEKASTAK